MIIEDMENIKTTVDYLNKEIVEVHCLLTKKDLSNEELNQARDMLINLNKKYYSLLIEYNLYTKVISKRIKDKNELYSKKSKYSCALAVIPCIGILFAIMGVLKNYNRILELREAKSLLDKFMDEVDPNLKIISGMLERKNKIVINEFEKQNQTEEVKLIKKASHND